MVAFSKNNVCHQDPKFDVSYLPFSLNPRLYPCLETLVHGCCLWKLATKCPPGGAWFHNTQFLLTVTKRTGRLQRCHSPEYKYTEPVKAEKKKNVTDNERHKMQLSPLL